MHDYKDSTSVGPMGGRGWPGYARRVKWPLVFGAAWVLLAAVDIGLLISSSRGLHAIARTTPAATRAASTTPAPSAPPSASPALASYLFRPASAASFGPRGTADGDDPGRAAAAVDSSQATAWTTSWYRTAIFGNLKRGTGLLLDLGSTATISGVRLQLGPARGADLEVLTGDTPVRTALVTRAAESHAGGLVQLTFQHLVRARYVLIWFTLLPPDRAGTYQVSVHDAEIQGRR